MLHRIMLHLNMNVLISCLVSHEMLIAGDGCQAYFHAA